MEIILKIYKKAKCIIVFVQVVISISFCKKESRENAETLIIKTDAIGDFIIFLDFAEKYKSFVGNKKVCLVTTSPNAEIAEQSGYFDEIIVINPKTLFFSKDVTLKTIKSIQKYRFKSVIYPASSRYSRIGDILSLFSMGSRKYAMVGDFSNQSKLTQSLLNNIYSDLISINESLSDLNQLTNFLRSITHSAAKSNLPKLSFIKEKTLISCSKYFVVFPGASWEGKKWPANKFSEVLIRISSTYPDYEIVFCGFGEADNLSIEEIRKELRRLNISSISLINKTNVLLLISTIRDSLFVITNDTSAAHIGLSLGKKTFILLGGGHSSRFLPYKNESGDSENSVIFTNRLDCFGCNWNCHLDLNEKYKCVRDIKTIDVVTEILKSLGGSSNFLHKQSTQSTK